MSEDSLNIQIAKAQGAFVENLHNPEDIEAGWVYFDPATSAFLPVLCTEERFAWSLASDYEHDLNLAWKLIASHKGAALIVDPYRPDEPFNCLIPKPGEDYDEIQVTENDAEPARAICRAWFRAQS